MANAFYMICMKADWPSIQCISEARHDVDRASVPVHSQHGSAHASVRAVLAGVHAM